MPRMDGTGPMNFSMREGRGMCRNNALNVGYACRRGLRRSCSESYVRNTESLKQYKNQLEKRLSEVRCLIQKLH